MNPPVALTESEVVQQVARALPPGEYQRKRILLIVPDATRSAPVGLMFKTIYNQIGGVVRNLDVLVALGTHPPMTQAAICDSLEISREDRRGRYAGVQLFNHQWDNPAALVEVGVIPAGDIASLTGGLFSMDVSVEINRLSLIHI